VQKRLSPQFQDTKPDLRDGPQKWRADSWEGYIGALFMSRGGQKEAETLIDHMVLYMI